MPNNDTFSRRRYLAAVALAGKTIEEIADSAGVSGRMIWYILKGERGASPEIIDVMRASVGEPAWAFVTGQRNDLVDAPLT